MNTPLVSKIIDRCLSKSIFSDHDAEVKARILTGTLAMGVVLSCFLTGLGFCFLPFSALQSVYTVLLTQIIFFLLIFLFLKYIGKVVFCTQLTLLTLYITSLALIYFAGGPFETPIDMLWFIAPMIAFILLDKKQGFLWTLLVVATQAFLITAARMNIEFPQIIPAEANLLIASILWLVSFFSIICVIHLFETNTARLRYERDIEHQQQQFFSTHDALTSLPNRGLFEMRLQRALARSKRNQQRVALILVNIDKFKLVNELLGTQAGDIVLKKTAERISSSVRQTDTVARISGDEFAVILEDFIAVTDARRIANLIQQKVSRSIEELGNSVTITASIGISLSPDHGLDANLLQHFADAAMVQAKLRRNCCCLYDPGLSN